MKKVKKMIIVFHTLNVVNTPNINGVWPELQAQLRLFISQKLIKKNIRKLVLFIRISCKFHDFSAL